MRSTRTRTIAWGGLALLLLVGPGCSRKDTVGTKEGGWTVLGAAIPVAALEEKAGAIRGALEQPEGAVVQVTGRIGEVCKAGCWFYLKDKDDMVYVDVQGEYVVPPSATGRKALVQAITDGEGGGRILKATTLCLK